MSDELDLLRKLHFDSVTEDELMDIFHRYRDNYRVQMHLVMHPKFPDNFALNIVSRLNAVDLIRVIKNNRTNPSTRKKAEMEFRQKYDKFPLGEKLGYMKMAPYSLMVQLIEEKDNRVVTAMLNNPYCTEDLVVRFINRYSPRAGVYGALVETEWYKRPSVAEAIAHDTEAPIRALLLVLPFLNRHSLRKLYENEATHEIVKKNIIEYLKESTLKV